MSINIKTARQAVDLSIAQLSELTGINYRQLQKYERGEANPENITLKNAVAIADALGIEARELL